MRRMMAFAKRMLGSLRGRKTQLALAVRLDNDALDRTQAGLGIFAGADAAEPQRSRPLSWEWCPGQAARKL
jgi:hypothetical protein